MRVSGRSLGELLADCPAVHARLLAVAKSLTPLRLVVMSPASWSLAPGSAGHVELALIPQLCRVMSRP